MPPPNPSFKVLVAPLDWGLGHATRCVPVIRQLLRDNCEVVIAASGATEALLKAEFPQLRFVLLFGYNIRYAAGGRWLPLRMAMQLPRILSAIRRENKWLRHLVGAERFDAVISDNRYGLHHPTVPCVFITHQLRIKAPFGWMETLLQRINYRYINRFTECWVPDDKSLPGLAGDLSHPARLPRIPLRYTGTLSRFGHESRGEGKHLLVLLSGPEPQRTVLEKRMVEGLKMYQAPAILVRGLPMANDELNIGSHITVYNHLPATELEVLLRKASFVIARCGYSTVMDVVAVGGRSVLIPTPGQTEQEYLAKHLARNGFAFCLPQSKFELMKALRAAQRFPYRSYPKPSTRQLQSTIQYFLNRLPGTK